MSEQTLPDDLMSTREVATELKVTIHSVRRWIASGQLPGYRLGGRLRVSRLDALSMLARVQPATGPMLPTRREVAEHAERVDKVLRDAGVRK